MRCSPFTAVFDACVLYPAPLRDLLMWLALSGRFRARWSEQIHHEWTRNLLRNRPDLDAALLARTVEPFDLDPASVVSAAQKQRQSLQNPAIEVPHYLDILRRQGLSQTVKQLAAYAAVL